MPRLTNCPKPGMCEHTGADSMGEAPLLAVPLWSSMLFIHRTTLLNVVAPCGVVLFSALHLSFRYSGHPVIATQPTHVAPTCICSNAQNLFSGKFAKRLIFWEQFPEGQVHLMAGSIITSPNTLMWPTMFSRWSRPDYSHQ
jgi:hypothetical protein